MYSFVLPSCFSLAANSFQYLLNCSCVKGVSFRTCSVCSSGFLLVGTGSLASSFKELRLGSVKVLFTEEVVPLSLGVLGGVGVVVTFDCPEVSSTPSLFFLPPQGKLSMCPE